MILNVTRLEACHIIDELQFSIENIWEEYPDRDPEIVRDALAARQKAVVVLMDFVYAKQAGVAP